MRVLPALLLCALVALLCGRPVHGQPPSCHDPDGPTCDLAVTTADATYSSTTGTVNLEATVVNKGDEDAPGFTVTAAAPGFQEQTKTAQPLAYGSETQLSWSFNVPDAARGTTVVFTVTAESIPDELTTDNNSAKSNSVDIPGGTTDNTAPQQQPDLTVKQPAAVVSSRAEVTVTATVANEGDAPAYHVVVGVTAPNWSEASTPPAIDKLPPGASKPVAFTLVIPDSARGTTVVFTVSAEPVANEKQTDNNQGSAGRYIPPLPPKHPKHPDIAVRSPTASRLGIHRVLVVATILNLGAAPATNVHVIASRSGWSALPRKRVLDLVRPGEPENVRFEFRIPRRQRGRRVTFTVTATPVQGDPAGNNTGVTNPVLVPVLPRAHAGTSGGLPTWPFILGGVLAALLLAALFFVLRGRPPTQPPRRAALNGQSHGPQAFPARTVGVGFAPPEDGATSLRPDAPLAPGSSYYFWVEIGPPIATAAASTAPTRPEALDGAELTVAVFAVGNAIDIDGADVARAQLPPEGPPEVLEQAAQQIRASDPTITRRRLFFRVRTAEHPGLGLLRCNFYCRGMLVQARLIHAAVAVAPARGRPAAPPLLDYDLAPSLDGARLSGLNEHRLSVFVNQSAESTHDFYFFGAEGFKSQASLDGQELQNLIENARGALRRVAWGDREPWAAGKRYRYVDADDDRLREDLVLMAITGYRFYDSIVNRLAGGPDGARRLADLMIAPGLVQVAARRSPRHVVPAALVYDYPLDTTAEITDYALCPSFTSGRARDIESSRLACFGGACPARNELLTVCPSGFWGFRHGLGMPVSVGPAPDAPTEIDYAKSPALVVAVSTDPEFSLRQHHEEALQALGAELGWNYANTRADTLRLLKQGKSEIVYFYCHGGVANDVPFIQVGPLAERGITRDLLRAEQIAWQSPRPLVFINGCHTAALEPDKAIDLVSGLVENARASGVIGTEISVFEPIATVFAEAFLKRFIAGVPIGEAVRQARLTLLDAGNPLGLVYIPFVSAGLQLRQVRVAEPAVPAPAATVD